MPSIPRPHLPSHLSSHLSLHRLKSHHSSHPKQLSTSSSLHDVSSPSSPTGSKPELVERLGLVLRAHVLKGRNLAAKDKTGTSDPFIILSLGDTKQATPVVSRSLNPEWNSAFDMHIHGVESLVLEVSCWDRDRFRKDYMGEVDILLEDIFKNGQATQEPQWYKLECRRSGRKSSNVSGDVLLQFQLHEPSPAPQLDGQHVSAVQKLRALIAAEMSQDSGDAEDSTRADLDHEHDLDDSEVDARHPGTMTPPSHEAIEKRDKRRRLARLKRKTKAKAYQYSGLSDVAGVLFLEIQKITDLPPERNATRTGFDMDPFVVTSLGKKTYRTRVMRHNLNPVYEEKLVFQVLRHEANYSVTFSVMDRDQFSNNDHVGMTTFSLETAKRSQPDSDPVTGLYQCVDTSDTAQPSEATKKPRFRNPLSRSSSSVNVNRSRNSSSNNLPKLSRTSSSHSAQASGHVDVASLSINAVPPSEEALVPVASETSPTSPAASTHCPPDPFAHLGHDHVDDPSLRYHALPLILKHKDRWEDKHKPILHIRAKYLPYQALRQQFWRAMLKEYDADDSGTIDKVELTTMLDTLGSTLRDATIDGFFQRFAAENGQSDSLTMDQVVICLEDRLQKAKSRASSTMSPTRRTSSQSSLQEPITVQPSARDTSGSSYGSIPLNNNSQSSLVPAIEVPHMDQAGAEGQYLPKNDLVGHDRADDEEHVVEIHECPICHQPRLNKKNNDADIITHIATCASQDWRAVNNLVMGGFVTSSQAQRKWYSKVISKIGYGGYKIGANSANILVQDRITGQINEERMSIYVRLGIRLLYKGLKSREMEKKKTRKLLRSLSIKQGRKYDDPASAAQIPAFVDFHQLDMSEVLLNLPDFKTFNEFFYRKLKPDARPCSAPDRGEIVTSPADCRTVVFDRIEDAQRIWVKGREFSVERLLGDAYPEDAARYKNCSLGIFRLAPQDYHRFHIPVDGIMGEPKTITGEYYTVNPMAIRSSLDVYGDNVRVVVPIDSKCHGRVMVICVGAMMVGSTIITRKSGEHVKRAEELGYFKFGGSTLLLLVEAGKMKFDQDLVDNSHGALETLIRVGMSIGHTPGHRPHLPDMRKDNPSMEERQDAKRRIEGSLSPGAMSIPSAANIM